MIELQEKTKRILLGLGILVFAAVFITSYAAFGNNGGPGASTTSTTIKSQATLYVTGNSTATITGYSSELYLTLRSYNSSINATVSSLLAKLENNNSVSAYVLNTNGYYVSLGNYTAYAFAQAVESKLPKNSSIVNATAYLSLPSRIKLYYRGVGLNVSMPRANYSMGSFSPLPTGTKLNVSIAALATVNGTVFDNQVRITYPGG